VKSARKVARVGISGWQWLLAHLGFQSLEAKNLWMRLPTHVLIETDLMPISSTSTVFPMTGSSSPTTRLVFMRDAGCKNLAVPQSRIPSGLASHWQERTMSRIPRTRSSQSRRREWSSKPRWQTRPSGRSTR